IVSSFLAERFRQLSNEASSRGLLEQCISLACVAFDRKRRQYAATGGSNGESWTRLRGPERCCFLAFVPTLGRRPWLPGRTMRRARISAAAAPRPKLRLRTHTGALAAPIRKNALCRPNQLSIRDGGVNIDPADSVGVSH